MKAGKDLRALVEEIERRRESKKDFVVERRGLKLAPEVDGVHLHVGQAADLTLNKVAHSQLASVLDIPKGYYDRCLTENPDLLAENVNAWFEHDPSRAHTIRTLDNVGCAVLSDRFNPLLEYDDLAEAAVPALLELDAEIMSAQITDSRLYIKAVDKNVSRELAKVGAYFGDGGHNIVRVTSPAITISTSEVGMGALSILAGVYDEHCSNLATFKERSLRKYHVGKQHDLGENIVEMLSNETLQKSNEALRLTVTDVVKGAFDEARFNALADKIEGTVSDSIDGDPVKVVELGRRKLNLTVDEGTSVLRHLIEGGQLNRFGLYNAITRASQDVESYDRASELERVGGALIDLPKGEWQELAQAA